MSINKHEKTFFWRKPGWWNFQPEQFDEFSQKSLVLDGIEDQIADVLQVNNLHDLMLRIMENEIRNSNAIEGIRMDSVALRSSLARGMGIINKDWSVKHQESGKEERAAKAAIEFLRNGRELYFQNILDAHARLAPNGEKWGEIRDHPESVFDDNNVSVYDAPGEKRGEVTILVNHFIRWWHESRPKFPVAVGSALSHFIFVTIHPFRDGNGRISRMIADKALIRPDRETNFRVFSMSAAINDNKNKYYELLNNAQVKGEIKPFINYMLRIQESALQTALVQANNLSRAREYIDSSRYVFSVAEKEIIFEMSIGNRQFWTMFEATKYMEDGEAAQTAWDSLNRLGVVANGMLDFTHTLSAPEQRTPLADR